MLVRVSLQSGGGFKVLLKILEWPVHPLGNPSLLPSTLELYSTFAAFYVALIKSSTPRIIGGLQLTVQSIFGCLQADCFCYWCSVSFAPYWRLSHTFAIIRLFIYVLNLILTIEAIAEGFKEGGGAVGVLTLFDLASYCPTVRNYPLRD